MHLYSCIPLGFLPFLTIVDDLYLGQVPLTFWGQYSANVFICESKLTLFLLEYYSIIFLKSLYDNVFKKLVKSLIVCIFCNIVPS